jgi:hypothetical protein
LSKCPAVAPVPSGKTRPSLTGQTVSSAKVISKVICGKSPVSIILGSNVPKRPSQLSIQNASVSVIVYASGDVSPNEAPLT